MGVAPSFGNELSQMFDGKDVLQGVRSIDVAVWLDLNGMMEFYPEKPITKSFEVSSLPTAG